MLTLSLAQTLGLALTLSHNTGLAKFSDSGVAKVAKCSDSGVVVASLAPCASDTQLHVNDWA